MSEDIIAILPEEVKGIGIHSRIFSTTETKLDNRTPTNYLDNMYKLKGKSKKLINKQIKILTQISRNLPYVIDANHVFFSFKYRITRYDDQGRGFVNIKYVEKIINTEIVLVTKERVATLNQKKSLIDNKNIAYMLWQKEIADLLKESDTIRYMTARIRQDEGGF